MINPFQYVYYLHFIIPAPGEKSAAFVSRDFQQQPEGQSQQLTPGSQQLMPGSQQLTPESQQLTAGSQQLTPESQQLTAGSQQLMPEVSN
ncbi:hypothetical protein GKZ89_08045 [Bacillus mangrovi]|uniref:Uncharacterized protein n=1 Tax=Metabacillus mangrovi TaxID=1491830 RepID=A0A7X2S507_9BACI|nr:hypothetical protein [Metabacillus mangrovi]MTH53365.1 hypothetical protein [Metabacillus mangrovi]